MPVVSRRQFLSALGLLFARPGRCRGSQTAWPRPVTLNVVADGYHGIWYANQPVPGSYRYKYSGGMATYTAKHRPFAVFAPEVRRTFFCYGAAPRNNPRRLLHAVGCFDHDSRTLFLPTLVVDKQTNDAHDNPVISLDADGHIWLFSTSHGQARPSFIHRSTKPFRTDEFEPVAATIETSDGKIVPFDNFSYGQIWYVNGAGFAFFFTWYGAPAARTLMFACSEDGVRWRNLCRLATIEEGHYQVSGVWIPPAGSSAPPILGTCFNYHPHRLGLNYRSNLYYVESRDFGRSWQTVCGKPVSLPLQQPDNEALVLETRSEARNVYLKDLAYDRVGRPVLLFVTSRGWRPGPEDGPRLWQIANWTGASWKVETVCESDNAYDMGTLRHASDGSWQLFAPVLPGPQRFNPGGEVAMLEQSPGTGKWRVKCAVTRGSVYNHNYVRRPFHYAPEFVALWSDGHGRHPSPVRLYMADSHGIPYKLPVRMNGPVRLE